MHFHSKQKRVLWILLIILSLNRYWPLWVSNLTFYMDHDRIKVRSDVFNVSLIWEQRAKRWFRNPARLHITHVLVLLKIRSWTSLLKCTRCSEVAWVFLTVVYLQFELPEFFQPLLMSHLCPSFQKQWTLLMRWVNEGDVGYVCIKPAATQQKIAVPCTF